MKKKLALLCLAFALVAPAGQAHPPTCDCYDLYLGAIARCQYNFEEGSPGYGDCMNQAEFEYIQCYSFSIC
jgi:hypothetical protein